MVPSGIPDALTANLRAGRPGPLAYPGIDPSADVPGRYVRRECARSSAANGRRSSRSAP